MKVKRCLFSFSVATLSLKSSILKISNSVVLVFFLPSFGLTNITTKNSINSKSALDRDNLLRFLLCILYIINKLLLYFTLLTGGKEFSFTSSLSSSLSCLPVAGSAGLSFTVLALYFVRCWSVHLSSSSAMVSFPVSPPHSALVASSLLIKDSHHCSCSSDILCELPFSLYRRSEREVDSFPVRYGRISFWIPFGRVGRMISGSPVVGCQSLYYAQFLYTIFAFPSFPRRNLKACG